MLVRTLENFLNRLGSAARKRRPFIPVVTIAFVTICMTALHERIEVPGADESIYAGLASNLLAGRGYQFNFEPYTTYPPGLPLIYAFVGRIIGVGYPARMLTTGVFAFVGLVMVYLVLRRRASEIVALGITLLLASGRYFFTSVTARPESDVPYFALSFVCLYLLDRFWHDSPSRRSRALTIVGLSVCLPLVVLTRTVGVAFLLALICFALIQAAKREPGRIGRPLALALPIAAGLFAFAFWTHWSSTHRPIRYEGEFSDQYPAEVFMKDFHNAEAGKATTADLATRVLTNCGCAGASFSQMSLSIGWIAPRLWSPLVAIPILLVSVGLFESFRRSGGDVSDWYVVFSLLILLIWWFCDDGQRFLLPIFPLLALQVFRGCSRLFEVFRKQPRRFMQAVILLGAAAACASIAAIFLQGDTPSKQHLASVVCWLLVTLSSAVFVARRKMPDPLDFPRRPWRLAYISFFACLIMASFLVQTVSAASVTYRDPRTMMHYPSLLVASWIVDNTGTNSVIMAEQGAILHRLTGRRLVALPASTDPLLVKSIIEKRRITYFVVEEREGFRQPDSHALFGVLQHVDSFALDLVARGPGYSIYLVASR